MLKRFLHLTRQKFVRDTFSIQLATLVQGGAYLLTSVLTARYLGAHEQGRWAVTREIYMFAYFLVSMGVVNATISLYSKAIGKKDRKVATNALAGLLKIGGATTFVMVVLGVTIGPVVGERFYEDREVGFFAGILTLSGVFEIIKSLTMVALQGSRQMLRFAYFDIASNVLRVGIVWIALESGYGLAAVSFAFVLHLALTAVIAIGAYQRARRGDPALAPPSFRELCRALPHAPIRHIFGLSYLIALNKGMNTLIPRLGMLLIPAHQIHDAMAKNGAYSVAYVLAWALALGLTGISQSLLPTIGHKLGRENVPFDQLGGMLCRVSLTSGGLLALATLLSVPFMYLVINVAYGAEYGESFELYLWLSSGNLFMGFFVIIDAFYIYSGKIRKVIPYNFVLSSIAVAGIILASKHFGAMGAAAAAGTCRLLSFFHLFYIIYYFRRVRHRRAANVSRATTVQRELAKPSRSVDK